MNKKIFISYLLGIFLLNISLVLAYHRGKGGGAPTNPLTAIIFLIGIIIGFVLVVLFLRKLSNNVKKILKEIKMLNKFIFLHHEVVLNDISRETVTAGLGPVQQYSITLLALIIIGIIAWFVRRKKN